MQDSNGVEWPEVRDIGDVRLGQKLSPAIQDAAGQFPYLRVANVHQGRIDYADVKTMRFTGAERKTFGLKFGDILLNEGQSLELVGRSAVYDRADGEFCFQNTLVRFRPGSRVLSRYAQVVFERWMATGVFAAIAKQTTSIAHLGAERFASLRFPLLPLSDQQRIVDVLDSAAKLERGIEASIAKLSLACEGIYQEVENELSGMEMGCVGEFFDVGSGVTISPDRQPKKRKRTYLRVANVQRGNLDLSSLAQVEEFSGDEAKYALREGDLLLVEGHASPREIGRCARVTSEAVGYLHQNHLFRLRSGQLLSKFSNFWLNSRPVRAYWRTVAATSSGLYTISRGAVAAIPFPIVDLQAQRRVVAELDFFDELIANEIDELAKVRAVKQGLVDNLLPGRAAV